METLDYIGFRMRYCGDKKEYEDAKSIVENHVRNALKNYKNQFSNELILCPLTFKGGASAPGYYVGFYFDYNNIPTFSLFKENNSKFDMIENIYPRIINNIRSSTWKILESKCQNYTSIQTYKAPIDTHYYNCTEKIHDDFIEDISNHNFSDYDIYKLLDQLKRKSSEAYEHSIRVGDNMQRLGELLGYDKDECQMLLYAGLLHDIGKCFTPDNILNHTASQFEPEERTVMEDHAARGAEFLDDHIIKNSDNPKWKPIWEAAGYHHQWSKDYPFKGMKKEDIPEIASWTTIFDIYDAMISKRCYKEEMTQDYVLNVMQKDADEGRLDVKKFKIFKSYLLESKFDFSESVVDKFEIKIERTQNLLDNELNRCFGTNKKGFDETRNINNKIVKFKSNYNKNVLGSM